VTHPTERRADSARGPLVRAAAQQFAHKPYSLVNLDDVVAAVEVSRGAMYFHFRSKQALAWAVIEEADKLGREAAAGVLANKLSGLETLIDLSYLVAVLDICEDWARAGLHLLGSIGQADELEARTWREVISSLAQIGRRAASEGDIAQGCDPHNIAHLLVAMYIGLRHTSDLEKPEQFLHDLEETWILLLPGFANSERMGFLSQFVRRRTAVASGKVSSKPNPA
jgi:AcrR family transcriptional regulator